MVGGTNRLFIKKYLEITRLLNINKASVITSLKKIFAHKDIPVMPQTNNDLAFKLTDFKNAS